MDPDHGMTPEELELLEGLSLEDLKLLVSDDSDEELNGNELIPRHSTPPRSPLPPIALKQPQPKDLDRNVPEDSDEEECTWNKYRVRHFTPPFSPLPPIALKEPQQPQPVDLEQLVSEEYEDEFNWNKQRPRYFTPPRSPLPPIALKKPEALEQHVSEDSDEEECSSNKYRPRHSTPPPCSPPPSIALKEPQQPQPVDLEHVSEEYEDEFSWNKHRARHFTSPRSPLPPGRKEPEALDNVSEDSDEEELDENELLSPRDFLEDDERAFDWSPRPSSSLNAVREPQLVDWRRISEDSDSEILNGNERHPRYYELRRGLEDSDEEDFSGNRRHYTPPRSLLPLIAWQEPQPCIFYGFDTSGFAVLRFETKIVENQYLELMRRMHSFYEYDQGSEIPMNYQGKFVIEVGEILVAKVADNVHEENLWKYIRCQVIKLLESSQSSIVMDIDDQNIHKVLISDLFLIERDFYKMEKFTISCCLENLEKYAFSPLLSEVALGLDNISGFKMYAHIKTKPDADADDDDPAIINIYTSRGEAESRSFSISNDVIHTIHDWNKGPIFAKGMVLDNVRITSVTPDGIIWIQFQSEVLNYVLNMTPNVNLRNVPLNEVVNKTRKERAEGKCYFVTRKGQDFFRVWITASVDTPTRSSGQLLPIDQPASFLTEQLLLVEHIDFGTREIVAISQLISFDYFDEDFLQISQQAVEAVLRSSCTLPGQMLLTKESLDCLLSSRVAIEIDEANFDVDLPLVTVHFLANRPFITRSLGQKHPLPISPKSSNLSSSPSSISPQASGSASGQSAATSPMSSTFNLSKIPVVVNRLPLPAEKRRPRGRNFTYADNPVQFKLKLTSSSHFSVLKEKRHYFDD